jgi:hypothetical protein
MKFFKIYKKHLHNYVIINLKNLDIFYTLIAEMYCSLITIFIYNGTIDFY